VEEKAPEHGGNEDAISRYGRSSQQKSAFEKELIRGATSLDVVQTKNGNFARYFV
jgi:hypothetical protein